MVDRATGYFASMGFGCKKSKVTALHFKHIGNDGVGRIGTLHAGLGIENDGEFLV